MSEIDASEQNADDDQIIQNLARAGFPEGSRPAFIFDDPNSDARQEG